MKRVAQFVVILGAFVFVAGLISSRIRQFEQNKTPQVVTTTTSIPTPTPIPALLVIPKLKIKAQIDPVGLTSTNNMDVPADASHVGWYMFGPMPSVRGNAVIAGHYDTPSGRPAIFYRLNRLVVGDTLDIELNDGTLHTFVVTGKDIIATDVFPEDYVFGTKYGINLNLITCNGVWDPVEKNYSKRLVVYATLKGTQFGTFP